MTTFDLVLDPGATALGFWIWENGGWYYNVPWMNFFGWMVTSLLAFGGFYMLFPQIKKLDKNITYWLSLSGIWSLIFWIAIAGWLGYWYLVIGGIVYLGYIRSQLILTK